MGETTSTKKKNINDFGARGWLLIIVGIFLNFMCSGIQVEASNFIIPNFADILAVSEAAIYAIATPLSILGYVSLFLFGLLGRRIGAKNIMLLSFLCNIISMILFATCTNFALYFVGRIFLQVGCSGIIQIGLSSMIANWFPTKKDLAQGWSTMGSNLATAAFLPIMYVLIAWLNFQKTFWVYGIVFLALAIVTAVFLKTNPEEAGCYPDNNKNMTIADAEALKAKEEEYVKTSPWTVGKLLKTKQVWQIAVGMGIIMLITVGMLMTMVNTLMMKGMTQTGAVAAMSVAAIVGLAASYLWGYIGVKLGTKRACLTVYIVVFAAIIFMLLPFNWSAYGVVFCVGCFIGAGNNLCPSLIQEIFGRYDFAAALVVIMPIWQVICGNASTIVGVPLSVTGNYVVSYLFLAVIAAVGFILIWRTDTTCIGRNEL